MYFQLLYIRNNTQKLNGVHFELTHGESNRLTDHDHCYTGLDRHCLHQLFGNLARDGFVHLGHVLADECLVVGEVRLVNGEGWNTRKGLSEEGGIVLRIEQKSRLESRHLDTIVKESKTIGSNYNGSNKH